MQHERNERTSLGNCFVSPNVQGLFATPGDGSEKRGEGREPDPLKEWEGGVETPPHYPTGRPIRGIRITEGGETKPPNHRQIGKIAPPKFKLFQAYDSLKTACCAPVN